MSKLELKSIIACNQSDGYLKRWAMEKLENLGVRRLVMFIRRLLVVLLGLVCFVLVPVSSAFSATTADVTITATPTYIAITNTVSTWVMGSVAEGTTYWWTSTGTAPAEPFVLGGMKSILTNTGSVEETFSVHAHNFTGGAGWALTAGAPGNCTVALSVGNISTTNEAAMLDLVDTTPQIMGNITAGSNTSWCMELKTGTFWDGEVKTGIVTVTATQKL